MTGYGLSIPFVRLPRDGHAPLRAPAPAFNRSFPPDLTLTARRFAVVLETWEEECAGGCPVTGEEFPRT